MMCMEPFPGKVRKVKGKYAHRYVLTDEQEEWFRTWFPQLRNDKLMRLTGMKASTLHRFARLYGLKKNERALHLILKTAAAKTKRKLERNGYYDSLRGKRPSEATIAATAKMWQEVREGIREHPFRLLKRKSPYRYKKMLKKRSESRKKAIRRDIIRLKWGLEPLQNYRQAVMVPYRRSQTVRRSSALRRGYILSDDCREGSGHRFVIYYDSEIVRAPIFERNCVKDGFTFKEWIYD